VSTQAVIAFASFVTLSLGGVAFPSSLVVSQFVEPPHWLRDGMTDECVYQQHLQKLMIVHE
jgi:regulator of sirC expression with transglutaminase-like and TPR domain